jgi:hypothetical protein
MKSHSRVAIPVAIGLAFAGLAGCENNEARVQGGGTTAPGAVLTSDDAGKIQPPPASGPPAGYGPAMGKRPPATVKAPSKDQESNPAAPADKK